MEHHRQEIGMLLHSLRNRFESGTKIHWDREGTSEVRLRLPKSKLKIRKEERNAKPSFLVAALRDDGSTLTEVRIDDQDENFDDARTLYDSADSEVQQAIRELIRYVETADHSIGLPHPERARTGPYVSQLPRTGEWIDATAESTAGFLAKIAGEWVLRFRGKSESIVIDETGGYRILLSAKGVRFDKPTFRVRLISCVPDLSRVEILKEEIDGSREYPEALNVSENEMVGFNLKDGHRLVYKRVRSPQPERP